MEGIPEQSDGSIDPKILEAREHCSITERISHQNWKVRKDVYDEISNSLDTLDDIVISEQICLYCSLNRYNAAFYLIIFIIFS